LLRSLIELLKSPGGFMRHILDLLVHIRESDHHVRINSRAREDITWWHMGLKKFHGNVGFKCNYASMTCRHSQHMPQ
jgi:hypothetical protein